MIPDLIMTVTETEGRFDAHVEGRYILTSAEPFTDVARALIAQGYDHTRRLVMKYADRELVDRAAPLGIAAGLAGTRPATARSIIF